MKPQQRKQNPDMEKTVTLGSTVGVVIGCLLIPFTDNPGLTIGMSTSFCAAIAMILTSEMNDDNRVS